MRKILAIDIDGVITLESELNDYGKVSFKTLMKKYYEAKPNKEMIKRINRAKKNYFILLYTSRNDYFRTITKRWLRENNVKYDEIVFNKPYYHYIIDDRALHDVPEE